MCIDIYMACSEACVQAYVLVMFRVSKPQCTALAEVFQKSKFLGLITIPDLSKNEVIVYV